MLQEWLVLSESRCFQPEREKQRPPDINLVEAYGKPARTVPALPTEAHARRIDTHESVLLSTFWCFSFSAIRLHHAGGTSYPISIDSVRCIGACRRATRLSGSLEAAVVGRSRSDAVAPSLVSEQRIHRIVCRADRFSLAGGNSDRMRSSTCVQTTGSHSISV